MFITTVMLLVNVVLLLILLLVDILLLAVIILLDVHILLLFRVIIPVYVFSTNLDSYTTLLIFLKLPVDILRTFVRSNIMF